VWILVLILTGLIGLSPAGSQATDGEVAGTVTDARGQPVSQAQLKISQITKSGRSRQVDAVDGVFDVALEPGYYLIDVSTPGHAPLRTKIVQVIASTTAPLEVVLPDEPTLLTKIPTVLWTIVGLLLTIIIQLVLPSVRSRWNRPKLRFEVKCEKPYCHNFNRRFPSGAGPESVFGIYFSRIMVINAGSFDGAKNVDLSITEIRKKISREADVEANRFVPGNLRWSNTWDIGELGFHNKAGENKIIIKDRISAKGGKRLCDFGFIVQPDRVNDFCEKTGIGSEDADSLPPNGSVRFFLCLEFIRQWSPRCLGPGEYCLELVCDCDSTYVKPSSFWVRLRIPTEFSVKDPAGLEIRCLSRQPNDWAEMTIC